MTKKNTPPESVPVHRVVGRVLKSCPFCGMEVCTHEAGFTHAENPNCFLFVMHANNGLSVPRGVYLEQLYAAWDMRFEIPPNPSITGAEASGASDCWADQNCNEGE